MSDNADIWVQTYTGKQFFPFRPHADQIDIQDIAAGLANRCRFGGQTHTYYSVAQHCVHVCEHTAHPRWGLLHDAAEAYLGDIPEPIRVAFPLHKATETKLLCTIAEKYGLTLPIPEEVYQTDLQLREAERRALMKPRRWPDDPPGPKPLDLVIQPWTPAKAQAKFLYLFNLFFVDFRCPF